MAPLPRPPDPLGTYREALPPLSPDQRSCAYCGGPLHDGNLLRLYLALEERAVRVARDPSVRRPPPAASCDGCRGRAMADSTDGLSAGESAAAESAAAGPAARKGGRLLAVAVAVIAAMLLVPALLLLVEHMLRDGSSP